MRIDSNNKRIRKGRLLTGFTLVEMLVSIAVFMSVMVVAIGAFISIVNANKKSQAMKSVVDNVTFAVDNISRDVKLGNDYRCASSPDGTSLSWGVPCAEGQNVLQYYDINKDTYVQYIFLSSDFLKDNLGRENEGNIQRRYCVNRDADDCLPTSWQSLTGPVDNIDIKNMKFYVLGNETNSEPRSENRTRRQPRVVITVEGSTGDINTISNTNFILQTTVSQMDRNNN